MMGTRELKLILASVESEVPVPSSRLLPFSNPSHILSTITRQTSSATDSGKRDSRVATRVDNDKLDLLLPAHLLHLPPPSPTTLIIRLDDQPLQLRDCNSLRLEYLQQFVRIE
jgi:hypothetical protein